MGGRQVRRTPRADGLRDHLVRGDGVDGPRQQPVGVGARPRAPRHRRLRAAGGDARDVELDACRKRGFAQGITHAFARLGNALTPPLVAWLILLVSWRGSFVVIGSISFLWAIMWGIYFRDDPAEHPAITQADLDRLPKKRARASRACAVRAPGGADVSVTLVYFCYGWTLWFFLAWIPSVFPRTATT